MVRNLYMLLGWILVSGAVTQFVLAGLGVFSEGSFFRMHALTGHLFGLVPMALLPVAVIGRLGRRAVALGAVALGLYALQYVFIESGSPVAAALHPLNGALLLITALAIALGDRLVVQRRPLAESE